MALTVSRRDGKVGAWQSIDLSEGGCFVVGPMLERGEQLEISLAFGEDEVLARARVAWINAGGVLSTRLPPGMGLEFVGLPEPVKARLREHLVRMQTAALPEITGELIDDDEATLPDGAMLGSYRIIRLLGAGGMGAVYECEHESLGRRVAVKTIHPTLSSDPLLVRRFFDEARCVNQIDHPNIVEITDFVDEGQRKYFVMELLEGRSVAQTMRDGFVPLGRALHILKQLARALGAAHAQGVTHRDLKPDNVFLTTKQGEEDFVKLLDFGIAKLAASSPNAQKTATGLLLGTPGYIAPEQILGSKTDHRADIYAFGCLAYQMISGRKVFVADSWPELLTKHTTLVPPPLEAEHTELPKALVALVMSCLEKKPEDRPQKMDVIADHLDLIAVDIRKDVVAPAPKERRFMGALFVAAAVALIVGVAWLATMAPKATPQPPPVVVASIPEPPATPAKGTGLRVEMAYDYMKARDYTQALQLCEALLQESHTPGIVYRAMAYAYAGLGKHEEACLALTAYKKLTPSAHDGPKVAAAIGGCR